jgi:hypothetical protein
MDWQFASTVMIWKFKHHMLCNTLSEDQPRLFGATAQRFTDVFCLHHRGNYINFCCYTTLFNFNIYVLFCFIFCTHPQIILGRSNGGEWDGRGMWHAYERRGKCTGFWLKKLEGKRPLGRPRRRWEDGNRMEVRGMEWGSVEWIQLAQDRNRWRVLVNMVMKLQILAPRS